MYIFASGQTERPPPTMADCPVDNGKPSRKRVKTSSGAPATPSDAHARAPEMIKTIYKKYQKSDNAELASRMDMIDCSKPSHFVHTVKEKVSKPLKETFKEFLGHEVEEEVVDPETSFEVKAVPGLLIYPNLFSPSVQRTLLDRVLHRDLTDPQHATNVHLHYDVPYPSSPTSGQPTSFFSPSATNLAYPPKASHSAITTQTLLSKKLRWITLGGQYDWTAKRYPPNTPPDFPSDIKKLIADLFPAMQPEAAICNLYSPGDTLAIHRDVSEECANPLVSISLGCEAIFIAGLQEPDANGKTKTAAIKLRSGDAVVMRGEARYAWHGVAKVMPETCPEYLRDWPAELGEEGGEFEAFRGWMRGKRVNLNVRQMFARVEEDGEEESGEAVGSETAGEQGSPQEAQSTGAGAVDQPSVPGAP